MPVKIEEYAPFWLEDRYNGSMVQPNLDSADFKELLKEALAETLDEKRELLHEVFAEVLEDLALGEAIREGQQTELVSRDEIFNVLEDRA